MSQQPTTTNVFLCCLSDASNESSIGFAMMLLTLPSCLQGADLRVHFVDDAVKGMQAFFDTHPKDGDVFVMMPTMMSGTEFVTSALDSTHKFVLAVHPRPEIKWDRVAQGLTPYTTNLEHLISTDPNQRGYVPTLPEDFKGKTHTAFWAKGSVFNNLGHANVFDWDGPVHADTKHQLTLMGKHGFAGCIGHRTSVR
jgi:hypothetical protein